MSSSREQVQSSRHHDGSPARWQTWESPESEKYRSRKDHSDTSHRSRKDRSDRSHSELCPFLRFTWSYIEIISHKTNFHKEYYQVFFSTVECFRIVLKSFCSVCFVSETEKVWVVLKRSKGLLLHDSIALLHWSLYHRCRLDTDHST